MPERAEAAGWDRGKSQPEIRARAGLSPVFQPEIRARAGLSPVFSCWWPSLGRRRQPSRKREGKSTGNGGKRSPRPGPRGTG